MRIVPGGDNGFNLGIEMISLVCNHHVLENILSITYIPVCSVDGVFNRLIASGILVGKGGLASFGRILGKCDIADRDVDGCEDVDAEEDEGGKVVVGGGRGGVVWRYRADNLEMADFSLVHSRESR